jgi:hypothetical protein
MILDSLIFCFAKEADEVSLKASDECQQLLIRHARPAPKIEAVIVKVIVGKCARAQQSKCLHSSQGSLH